MLPIVSKFHPLPDFLILGTQKGGTTSLYRWLAEHPGFRAARTKEVHYFDNRFDRGTGWYRGHFPPLWRRGRGTITGEATPSYLFAPSVPARVAATLPHARFVVLLRDPVKRAYSHYHHNVRMEREPRSFADAVAEEVGALDAEPVPDGDEPSRFRRNAYVERGLYARQLERWEEAVGRDRLRVEFSERLFSAPTEVLTEIAEFLGLRPFAWERTETRRAHNRYPYDPIDPAVAAELAAWYRPHDDRLAARLGRALPWR